MKKKKKNSEKKSVLAEFRAFIARGNVLDMAVGVLIAGAFGKITTSLVNDILMPLIGTLLGKIDLSALNLTIVPAVVSDGTIEREAVVIGLGTFLTTVLDFFLVALVVFFVGKGFNTLRDRMDRKKKEQEKEQPEPAPAKPSTEELLSEIRDLLAQQTNGDSARKE